MSRTKSLLVGTLATAILGASALAYANRGAAEAQSDAAALAQAKITLTQAIAAAEQQTHGKAVRAVLENENGQFVYGVEVVSGDKTTDVKVDIATGAVLSAQADRTEHEAAESTSDSEQDD